MATTDPWNNTDRLEAPVLDAMVERLEARGRNPFYMAMMAEYLEAMEIDRCARVLDLGCGTGIAARVIAARPGFGGEVLGIDLSDHLVAAAERLAAEEGVGARLRFAVGDSAGLALEDGGFDAVVAHTLFSHVSDPAAVLAEAARLVAPGGRVAVFDGDYASMTFEQADAEKAAADEAAVIAAVVAQPRVMRAMPRLAKAAGLEIEAVQGSVLAEAGTADFWVSGIEGLRKLLPSSGAMSQAEADAFVDGQLAASARGEFFGASNYYAYVLRR